MGAINFTLFSNFLHDIIILICLVSGTTCVCGSYADIPPMNQEGVGICSPLHKLLG